MATKKEKPKKQETKGQKTKKQKAKKDIMDFIADACRDDSTVGMHFIAELNKAGAKAKDLHQLLVDWGYDGVLMNRLLKVFKTTQSQEGSAGNGTGCMF